MLEILSHPLLQNPYIKGVVIFFGFYLLSEIAHFILIKYISLLTKKTQTDIDDKIFAKIIPLLIQKPQLLIPMLLHLKRYLHYINPHLLDQD